MFIFPPAVPLPTKLILPILTVGVAIYDVGLHDQAPFVTGLLTQPLISILFASLTVIVAAVVLFPEIVKAIV
jgi:hypothetical protein